ncbi:MAG: polyprenyl synthetase family protein [Opitutaceae bacterium]|nr:polyprenyl synthetase family protein [Cytophagales bacterium]
MLYNAEFALQRINGELLLLELGDNPRELYEPLRYILGLGGKRLRPMLTLLACSMFSEDFTKALKPALAIEVFHNFSLIHDDIMDQALVRRGKPTVHEKWDIPTAILSGDVALVEAYKLMIQVEDNLKMKAFSLFSQVAKEVCEGQQMDMLFEKKEKVSVAEYMEMIRLKTAVLLGFSLQIGGLVGGSTDSDAEKLKSFGQNIGLAFQIKDDYLDSFGDGPKVGKTIGGDIRVNKKTFLFTKSLEIGNSEASKRLLELYSKEDNSDQKVHEVLEIYKHLNIKEECEKEIFNLYNQSISNLIGIKADMHKTARLRRFADELMERVS